MPRREDGWWRELPASVRRALKGLYRSLRARYRVEDPLAREFAKLVCEAWLSASQSSEAATAAAARRRYGRGRRPNVVMVARLQKRSALNVSSLDQMLKRLEELGGRRGRDAATVLGLK